MLIGFVPVMLFVILERAWHEIKSIPLYIRCDLSENYNAFKWYWRHPWKKQEWEKPR